VHAAKKPMDERGCNRNVASAQTPFPVEIAFVLALFVLAVVLFAAERFPVDVVTLGLVVLLVLGGVLTPREAFAGFGSELVIMLGAIFVAGAALQRSGVLQWLADLALKAGGESEARLTATLMVVAGAVSAFMNNTAVTAMFLVPVLGMAKRRGLSPSRLLMPLAFASILGGTCTLIGTSTNIAVSSVLADAGWKPVGMFEIAPVGLVLLGAGAVYMVVAGRRWLPQTPLEPVTPREALRAYLCEATVLEASPLVGQRAFGWELLLLDCRILKIIRGKRELVPTSKTIIRPGDHLLIEGDVENLVKVQRIEGLRVETRREAADAGVAGGDVRVAEVLLSHQCELLGQTLREADVRQRYGLTVMAINRHGKPLIGRLGEVELEVGDVLLVQARQDRLAALRRDHGLYLLDQFDSPAPRGWRDWVSAACFLLAVVAGSAGWAPMSVCFLAAALATILSGALSVESAREAVEWRLLILIGGMTAFGRAMENSGAADQLSGWIVAGLRPWGTGAVLTGFFVLTVLLTQPMSNAAAALVVLPVAMAAAQELGADPRSFGIAVMLAASVSFLTPFEPSCLLVYGPGKYRFRDFVLVGGGLTLLLSVLVLCLIPVFWPLD
jgi:di/tricarboxylate transporter